jgi:quinol monooxygenase YgiN
MSEPIIFVDTFNIRAGKLEDFKQATKEIVELVQSNEPQLLLYGVHLNNDGTQMTGVQMHTDSASIEKHFMVAGPHFGKVMECLEGGGKMEVFGSPSDNVRQQMEQMASSMGVAVTFSDLFAGFARLKGVQ